jgi:hypothetical protein
MEEDATEREESGSDEVSPDDTDEPTTRSIEWPPYLSESFLPHLFHAHPVFSFEVQSVLLFRRPIASISLLIFINSFFFLYRWANLPFLSLSVLVLTFYFLGNSVIEFVIPIFFTGQVNRGAQNEFNRIREPEELNGFLKSVWTPILIIGKLIYAVYTDPSQFGYLSISFMFFALTVLTAAVDLFWIVVVVVNGLLIGPGVWMHPVCQYYWKTLIESD